MDGLSEPAAIGHAERSHPALIDVLGEAALPASTELVATVLRRAFEQADVDVAHHAVRTFAFASLLAPTFGDDDVSADLLFTAAVLHDVGLSTLSTSREPFEVVDADAARDLLVAHGYDDHDAEVVWDAIALHSSGGIAERRGVITRLTRAGVGCDFSRFVERIAPDVAGAVFEQFPRRNFAHALAAEVERHVAPDPVRGPRYSFPSEIHREFTLGPTVTEMELDTLQSPWDLPAAGHDDG